MKPSRPIVLVAVFAVAALITWLLMQRVYSSLPAIPWTAIPTVLLLALGEGYSGWMTRARLNRKYDTKPIEALAVARLAALAKASAHAGAVFGGIFAGILLHVMVLLHQDAAQTDFYITGGSLIACVLLICAALYLEYCCRVPKEDEKPK